MQLTIASEYRQTPWAAVSYLAGEFPPAVVGSAFIKLECQHKKNKSRTIKKNPALPSVSDLNYPCSHWHKQKKKISDSVRINSLHHQSAAVVHLSVRFTSAIHPVFRSVISFPFGKFPEHNKENASTDGEKRYLLICRKHLCSLIAKS